MSTDFLPPELGGPPYPVAAQATPADGTIHTTPSGMQLQWIGGQLVPLVDTPQPQPQPPSVAPAVAPVSANEPPIEVQQPPPNAPVLPPEVAAAGFTSEPPAESLPPQEPPPAEVSQPEEPAPWVPDELLTAPGVSQALASRQEANIEVAKAEADQAALDAQMEYERMQAESNAYADIAENAQQRAEAHQALRANAMERIEKGRDAYMNSEENPNRAWENMSDWGRMGTLFAVFLGGMFSKETGGVNQVMQAWNTIIDRDIAAQRSNRAAQLQNVSLLKEDLADKDAQYGLDMADYEKQRMTRLQSLLKHIDSHQKVASTPTELARINEARSAVELELAQTYSSFAEKEANFELRAAELQAKISGMRGYGGGGGGGITQDKIRQNPQEAFRQLSQRRPDHPLLHGLDVLGNPMSEEALHRAKLGDVNYYISPFAKDHERTVLIGPLEDVVDADSAQRNVVLFKNNEAYQEFSEKFGSAQNIAKLNSDLHRLLQDGGAVSGKLFGVEVGKDEKSALITAITAQLAMQYKNYHTLGVLAGPDMDLIKGLIGGKEKTDVDQGAIQKALETAFNSTDSETGGEAALKRALLTLQFSTDKLVEELHTTVNDPTKVSFVATKDRGIVKRHFPDPPKLPDKGSRDAQLMSTWVEAFNNQNVDPAVKTEARKNLAASNFLQQDSSVDVVNGKLVPATREEGESKYRRAEKLVDRIEWARKNNLVGEGGIFSENLASLSHVVGALPKVEKVWESAGEGQGRMVESKLSPEEVAKLDTLAKRISGVFGVPLDEVRAAVSERITGSKTEIQSRNTEKVRKEAVTWAKNVVKWPDNVADRWGTLLANGNRAQLLSRLSELRTKQPNLSPEELIRLVEIGPSAAEDL